MEDKVLEKSQEWSKEELLKRAFDKRGREMTIARTRASVVKSQVVEAYRTLEDIRLDYLGDTAFRDKWTRAKKNLESMIDDFLLSDMYWEQRIDNHWEKTPEEYDKEQKSIVGEEGVSYSKVPKKGEIPFTTGNLPDIKATNTK